MCDHNHNETKDLFDRGLCTAIHLGINIGYWFIHNHDFGCAVVVLVDDFGSDIAVQVDNSLPPAFY